MTDHDSFTFKEFPKIRHGYIEVLRERQRKRFIHGLFEVDVTDVCLWLRKYKTRIGETLSFTAFVIHCLGKAVDVNKILHVMRQGSNKLALFDEVDVGTQIEVEVDGTRSSSRTWCAPPTENLSVRFTMKFEPRRRGSRRMGK